MSKRYSQTGVAGNLELGKGGPRVKDSSGALAARNAADSANVTIDVATPTADAHAATKAYVDSLANGLNWMDPVVVVATSNLTLSGEQTIDGVLTSGSRVLLTGQTSADENGVWVTGAGAWTRPADFNTGDNAASKTMMVEQGSTNADTQWTCTSDSGSAVIDTNNLAFSQIASTVGGVTSVNDAAAVPSGGQSLLESSGTGAVTTRVLDDSSTIGYVEASGVITPSVKSSSIDTNELADDAVTEAKLAALATEHVRTVGFGFADADTFKNIGAALPANAVVTDVFIRVTTAFDNDSNLTVGTSGVPSLLMLASESNSLVADVYEGGARYETGGASSQLGITLGSVASAPTAGAGFVVIKYIVTA